MNASDKHPTLTPEDSVHQAIQMLEAEATKIVLVVNTDRRLLGTVTDGDIRRAILRRVGLEDSISLAMNVSPVVAKQSDSSETVMALMKSHFVRQMPILDEDGRVVGLETISRLAEAQNRENMVLLMAGGFGKRLMPLTESSPKPMVEVGSRPILETIVKSLANKGFRKICISVHYKADDIMNHFGDGSALSVNITYIQENEALGTAGALRLLPERPTAPFLVMNADILTKVNFEQLLEFHTETAAKGTICVREYDFTLPYGIVEIDEHKFTGIVEKPVHKFLVNAGIYVLDPSALDCVPTEGIFDMPKLFESLHKRADQVVVFPITEYWTDIGRLEDLERARSDYDSVFP